MLKKSVSSTAVVNQGAVKKIAVKKTVARKAGAPVATRATAKQAAVKQTAVKKAVAKKVVAKKIVAKKAVAKNVMAKPTVKQAAVKKTTAQPLVKAAVKRDHIAAAKKSVKAAVKPLVPTAGMAKGKIKKSKLVRDSFTMPENEYQILNDVKKAFLKSGIAVKKSELLRAGVILLNTTSQDKLRVVIAGLPALKAGRPKKDK